MNNRSARITVALGLALLWLGYAVHSVQPATYADYHRTALQVAESAHDAVTSGVLAGRQELAGQVFAAFSETAFEDATRALAGAAKQFAEDPPPPDPPSRALRDTLAPLLSRATVALGDAAQAPGDAALRRAVNQLAALQERLDDFVTAHS
jgi:hypothetical protein